MPRSPGHYEEWLAACKGGPRPVSNFDYAGPLTEIVLARRAGPPLARPAARMGQCEPQSEKRPRAQSIHSHRIPQRLGALK